MRRSIRLIVALVLCLCMCAALADTYYVKPDTSVSLRDESTNDVLITIPAGTALEPVGDKSTDLCAYVTYGGFSGLVLWNYLTRTAPADMPPDDVDPFATKAPIVSAETPAPNPTPTPAPTPAPTPENTTLRTVNAVIQRANSRNKAEGATMTEMVVTPSDNVIITAQVPRGKKLVGWLFNGVHYNLMRSVKSLRLTNIDRSWTIEAVFKNTNPSTIHTPEAIQAARTGLQLLAEVKNGEFCHLKEGTTGGGGWIKQFDFTNDYTNRATGALERGGQLTAKVRATIPRGKRVVGWKFDETHVYTVGVAVKQFVVYTLDTSMVYEPIFDKVTETKPPVTDPPTPTTRYYNVTCRGCDFSGGGYTHATSGTVPANTKITVYTKFMGGVAEWRVNGGSLMSGGEYVQSNTITRTIKSDTTIVCIQQIN
ncbi:MAG: hypothetical protein IJK28_05990 [Clostridia bacterium]|nr:hypothetical protein [Clostridia bacterium]